MEARRRYFQTGEMPRNGTVCQPEVVPFGDELNEMSLENELDRAMLDLVHLVM